MLVEGRKMTLLEQDLDRYKDEFFTGKDIRAGLALLLEIAGMVSILTALLTITTVWLPGLGIPISTGTAYVLCRKAGEAYADLPADQRKLIRAAVSFMHRIVPGL